MDRVRKLVGASRAYEQGFYGEGIGVAVLDSGIQKEHPDLKGRLVYSHNYLTASKEAGDDCGHGTHICGIIGGTGVASGGRYQGLAPRCHFLSLKVLDAQGNGSSGLMAEALYWLIDHGREYDVRLINISAGAAHTEERKNTGLLRAVEDAWDAGFLVCAAAGNEGPARSSVTVPGTSPKVITVGASDDGHMVRVHGVRKKNYSGRGPTSSCVCKPDVVAPGYRLMSCNSEFNNMVRVHGVRKKNYSGRGPTSSCVCKPDVVAPGYRLMSCNSEFNKPGKGWYTAKSGTSMATPVVTGCLALLLSSQKGMTNKEVKLKLRSSCLDLGLWYTAKSGTSMATPVVTGCLALLLSSQKGMTNKEVKLKLRSSCLDLGLSHNRQGWGHIWLPGLLT